MDTECCGEPSSQTMTEADQGGGVARSNCELQSVEVTGHHSFLAASADDMAMLCFSLGLAIFCQPAKNLDSFQLQI